MRRLLSVLSICAWLAPQSVRATPETDLARWKAQAARVTIIRDVYGVPHIYGKSDADAVFGLLYAQAEDDFNRIETNYINASGRMAEVEGESAVYQDLRMKLFINPAEMKALYAKSPAWLKLLMNAFADGLNYYLYTHPAVKPRLLTHFEPWMALTFSEGSIGGDIESVSLSELGQFYGKPASAGASGNGFASAVQSGVQRLRDAGLSPDGFVTAGGLRVDAVTGMPQEPNGSNGFAIAPSRSASGHAMLLINPHTSFYFRPEVNVVSDEGLNAYGAVTWGQIFVYQGFNNRIGWMHTSGGGDVIDEYTETVTERDGKFFYQYGNEQRPLKAVTIDVPYREGSTLAHRKITAYYSHHGPIVRKLGSKWVAVRMMNNPMIAIQQSYLRTKATSYAAFAKVMELRTNSSNNTVYADADGNIAYWHGNFVPKRDVTIDFSKTVDGSNPATDWKGLHASKETIQLFNPKNGWLYNTNNWPFTAAGSESPKAKDYPKYMNENPENPRGVHAVRVLQNAKGVDLDGLVALANDSYLTAFEPLLPTLFRAYDSAPAGQAKSALAEQIAVLRGWDLRYSLTSVPTSLAIYWAQDLMARSARPAKEKDVSVYDYMAANTTAAEKLEALARASAKLTADFGSWKTPWGDINRFQRLTGDIVQPFDDSKPSLPVAFTSSAWGSLAAFGMTTRANTKRIYGDRGNSFEAVVDFGPTIKAKSILAGGESGDPTSKHFTDQAERYTKQQFKDVYFYRKDVEAHAERTYHPGS